MVPLDARRFLYVTGKGGTGKTTVVVALALALAARGRRVLIALAEPKERVSHLFGVPPLGPEVRSILPNISAVKISSEAALREYGEMVLKSRVLYRAVFENPYVKAFFAAVPGLSAWAMLGKAWFHSTEKRPDGTPRFDVVLFDAPATGHGIEMLRVPKVIVEVAPPGLLRRDAERAWALFRDPTRSGVVIVSLAEDMPANESIELAQTLQGELELPIAQVIVNQVIDPLFTPEERVRLGSFVPRPGDGPGDSALAAAARRAITEQAQAESLEKIRGAIQAPLVTLTRLLVDPSTPETLRILSALLGERLFPPPTRA